MLTAMLFALCLTLAVEVPLAALLRVRGWDLVLIGLINCVTNPLVNLIYAWALLSFPQGSPLPYFVLAALELAAVFGEGLAFRLTLRWVNTGARSITVPSGTRIAVAFGTTSPSSPGK